MEQNETIPTRYLIDLLTRPDGESLTVGQLGLVASRAGVGKTAFLVQLALDTLLSGKVVIHVALDQTLEHVQARYDTLLADRLRSRGTAEREDLTIQLAQRRAIQVMPTETLAPKRLQTVLETFRNHLGLEPAMLVIDGAELEDNVSLLPAYKGIAKAAGAVLWMSARSGHDFGREFLETVDLGVKLRSEEDAVLVSSLPAGAFALRLSHGDLRPIQDPSSRVKRPGDHTLLSGAAPGAEALFGELAERWGMKERNFTFSGRKTARQRGLVVLAPEELTLGDVSWTYLKTRLHREFEPSEKFKKVLQSIWHQVNPTGEVFSVGVIQPKGTIKGGTGWAVELAKHQHKSVWVFDQNIDCWFEWFEDDWRACNPPTIQHFRFTGTGTRHLNPAGQKAIESLFERTFGPARA